MWKVCRVRRFYMGNIFFPKITRHGASPHAEGFALVSILLKCFAFLYKHSQKVDLGEPQKTPRLHIGTRFVYVHVTASDKSKYKIHIKTNG